MAKEKLIPEPAVVLKEQDGAAVNKAKEKIIEEFEKKYAAKEVKLNLEEAKLNLEHERFLNKIEEKKKELSQREDKIREAEIVMKNGFSDQRSKLAAELTEEKEKINKEISDYRLKRLAELDKLIETEYSSRIAAIEKEIKDKLAKFEAEKKAEEHELEKQRNSINAEQLNLEKGKKDVEFQRLRLDRESEELKRQEAEVKEKARREYEHKITGLEKYRDELLEQLRSIRKLEDLKDELRRKYGDDPEAFRNEMDELRKELDKKKEKNEKWLEEKRAEIKAELDSRDKELEDLRGKNKSLKDDLLKLRQDKADAMSALEENYAKMNSFVDEKEILKHEKNCIEREKSTLEADCVMLKDELQKYRNYFKDAEGVENRKATIETPWFTDDRHRTTEKVSEIEWLSRIHKSCEDCGYIFSKRLLYAFHTALKTSDWSSITVLAGVSGTGKSKLPELYSHFGGINFFNLPVQPNWDSKESMLGFFNSIERTFDAQPVLQFLAQTQKDKTKEYLFGLKDTLSLVLLDEMNLANVELYFAEFLSKLEERSGKKIGEEPTIDIKLGSGQSDYYRLPLGRNVLWVGTMNQDETTKTLSDKVLDRGIVISFPRPTSLAHKERKPLSDSNRAPLLTVNMWDKWKSTNEVFKAPWVEPCRKVMEEVNGYMGQIGLAIGHRVWQGIEQYMGNHPRVLAAWAEYKEAEKSKDEDRMKSTAKEGDAALKDAFEDQLAQKVMPKLRGTETSGDHGEKCLKPIMALLKQKDYEELVNDFENAMKFGNGQFVWNSSGYLNKY